MIIGIGIDLTSVVRIRDVLMRWDGRFTSKVLTDKERAFMPSAGQRKIDWIAGRFAAKEAASKALGTVCSSHSPKSLSQYKGSNDGQLRCIGA